MSRQETTPESSLPAGEPLVDATRLATLLGPLACRFDVDARTVCDSTNSVLLTSAGAPSGRVVVADRQTGGRGRRGRTWISDPRSGLTFSLLWRFPRPAAAMAGLSLAVGVALVRGLDALGVAVALKWPNDLLRPLGPGWGKVGGVLVEMVGEGGCSSAVIGIGINLLAPTAAIEASLPALGLAEPEAVVPERHAVLAAVLSELAPVLDRFAGDGFAPFVAEWQQRHAFADRMVRIEEGGKPLGDGRCLGVDSDGALRVEIDGRPVRWLSGDVSLRPA